MPEELEAVIEEEQAQNGVTRKQSLARMSRTISSVFRAFC